MVDPVKAFDPVARAIGETVGGSVWRWQGYHRSEALICTIHNDGKNLEFRRSTDKKALLWLSEIQPHGVTDLVVHEPQVLSNDDIDQAHIVIRNIHSDEPRPAKYTVEFTEIKTAEDAISEGFSTAISNTFKVTAGGDAYGGSIENETSIEETISHEATKTLGTEEGASRGFDDDLICPAHEDVDYWQTWSVQKMRVKITGYGTFDFEIRIGKHWDHKWHHSKHWVSIADLIAVAEDAPDRPTSWHDLEYLPREGTLLALKQRVEAPFVDYKEYDNVQNIELNSKVLQRFSTALTPSTPAEVTGPSEEF